MDVSSDVLEVLQLLLKLRDLDELGDVALLDLARDARIDVLRKGEILLADEHLDRHVYLIEGEVALIADGKKMQSITAGTERALLPLFRVHTHGFTARCVREARVLSLNEATFERYTATIRPRQEAGISVEEYASSGNRISLIDEIRHDFYHQEVDLPSMPEVAVRISRAVQNQEADFRKIATTVQADPVIAARIVQVANSAMYAGIRPVESVQNAITRIGLQATRAIVMSVVVKNLFKPKQPLVRSRMKAYYHHSIQVAAISHALSACLAEFDAEHAFLAGLMHDIGVLPVLIQADGRADLYQDAGLLEQVIRELGSAVGAMLLEQWGFEADLITVAREAENWMREVETADYCDIVQIAQLNCSMVGGRKIEAPAMNILPAFERLHLEQVEPVKVIQEARQDIKEIISLLT